MASCHGPSPPGKRVNNVFSRESAPREKRPLAVPDGTQNGAGSTPSHDEAIRRAGANVVANPYASPRTAYASGMHASASQNPSSHGWPAQHMGQTLDFGQMALTPTRAMHGYNIPSFVSSTPTASPSQSQYWHSQGGAQLHSQYVPFHPNEHMMRQHHHTTPSPHPFAPHYASHPIASSSHRYDRARGLLHLKSS